MRSSRPLCSFDWSKEVSDDARIEYVRLQAVRGEAGKERKINIIVNRYTSRLTKWVGQLEAKTMSVGESTRLQTGYMCGRRACDCEGMSAAMGNVIGESTKHIVN